MGSTESTASVRALAALDLLCAYRHSVALGLALHGYAVHAGLKYSTVPLACSAADNVVFSEVLAVTSFAAGAFGLWEMVLRRSAGSSILSGMLEKTIGLGILGCSSAPMICFLGDW